jgi:hypothetical protein
MTDKVVSLRGRMGHGSKAPRVLTKKQVEHYGQLQVRYDSLYALCQSQLELLHAVVLRHGRQVFDIPTMQRECHPNGAHAFIEGDRLIVELRPDEPDTSGVT